MTALEHARAVADAVLYEGYVLYPYRASAPKNRVRWQWGVLMPADVVERDKSERSWNRTDLVVDGRATSLRATVRVSAVGCGTQSRRPDGWVGNACVNVTLLVESAPAMIVDAEPV